MRDEHWAARHATFRMDFAWHILILMTANDHLPNGNSICAYVEGARICAYSMMHHALKFMHDLFCCVIKYSITGWHYSRNVMLTLGVSF